MASSQCKVFPYISGWPKIMAKLSSGENTPRYFEFLIDSGSDYTLIGQSDALILGIDYKNIKGVFDKFDILFQESQQRVVLKKLIN